MCDGAAMFKEEIYLGSDDDSDYEIHNVFAAKNHSHGQYATNDAVNAAINNVNNRITGEVNAINGRIATINERVDTIDIEIDELDERVDTFQELIEDGFELTRHVNEKLKEDIESRYASIIERMEQDKESMRTEIKQLNSKLSEILSRMKTMCENERILFKLMDIYTDISALKERLTSVEGKGDSVAGLRRDVYGFNKIVLDIKAQVDEFGATVRGWSNDFSQFTTRLDSLNAAVEAVGHANTAIESRLNTIEADIAALKTASSGSSAASQAGETHTVQECWDEIQRLAELIDNDDEPAAEPTEGDGN